MTVRLRSESTNQVKPIKTLFGESEWSENEVSLFIDH